MIENNTLISVKNRDNGVVGYTIPDLGNLNRTFSVGEVKQLTMEELRKLSYIPGGMYILKNCLLVENKEALDELFIDVEPEYFYTEERIKELLLKGSLDEFLDCLDFAPKGVIELVKDLAVRLQINDLAKRDAILEKTGFNVSTAIYVNKETEEETKEDKKERRAATPSNQAAKETTGRRTPAPKYNVVEKKN